MTGMLSQSATCVLRRTDQQSDMVELLFMWETNWNDVSSSAKKGKKTVLKAYGLKLRGRLIQLTL